MEKKQDEETLEARKALVKKLALYLAGRADSKKRTDIISHFLVLHDENIKKSSLDEMNEVAKFYLKKRGELDETE